MTDFSKTNTVSVIVPVYNVELYLEKCILSLVNQTLQNIEIIIVNDGSSDGSQLIIDRYEAECPSKIKAFTKENGGLSDARNFGIERASGDFIGFVELRNELGLIENSTAQLEYLECVLHVSLDFREKEQF